MKISYDPEADAVYIKFGQGTVRTEHWSNGVAADFDVEGRLLGIELLDASQLLGELDVLKDLDFVEFPKHRARRRA